MKHLFARSLVACVLLMLLLTLAACAEEVPIDAGHFPDAAFRALVEAYDTDRNGGLSSQENSKVTYMNIERSGVTDLTGIGHFTALTLLYCGDNRLTALDVSENAALEKLGCSSCQLVSLNVSQNAALTFLDCRANRLTELDIGNNPALETLYCYDNALTELDVSHNTALTQLFCDSNQLATLDVTQNPALVDLSCSGNALTEIAFKGNALLEGLHCQDNRLTQLDIGDAVRLNGLECQNNQLSALDIENNKVLTFLDCSSNGLTTLDVSHNTALALLYCNGNPLSSLDIRQCPGLVACVASSAHIYSPDLGYAYHEWYHQRFYEIRYDPSVPLLADATLNVLILPEGLKAISTEAFTGISADAVVCPPGLREIGASAFADCGQLKAVYIRDSSTSIADSAFDGCDSLVIISSDAGVRDWVLSQGFQWRER